MDKKTLSDLTIKKSKQDSRVIAVRVSQRVYDALKKKDIDIAKTIKHLLERLAE